MGKWLNGIQQITPGNRQMIMVAHQVLSTHRWKWHHDHKCQCHRQHRRYQCWGWYYQFNFSRRRFIRNLSESVRGQNSGKKISLSNLQNEDVIKWNGLEWTSQPDGLKLPATLTDPIQRDYSLLTDMHLKSPRPVRMACCMWPNSNNATSNRCVFYSESNTAMGAGGWIDQ